MSRQAQLDALRRTLNVATAMLDTLNAPPPEPGVVPDPEDAPKRVGDLLHAFAPSAVSEMKSTGSSAQVHRLLLYLARYGNFTPEELAAFAERGGLL